MPKKWANNLCRLDENINEIGFFTYGEASIRFNDNKKENLSKLDKSINEIGFFAKGEPSIEFKDSNKNKLFNNTPFKHF